MAFQKLNLQNQDYEFEIKISNGINEITLGTEAIIYLSITENLFRWFDMGTIILDNLYLNLNRYPEYDDSNKVSDDVLKKTFYKFRSDGRDTIKISFKPVKNEKYEQYILEKNWNLELEGVIYDFEDVDIENNENKKVVLYFHDKSYQLMKEKNAEFSTATKALEKNGKSIYSATNQDRSLRTGEAIAELLKETGFSKHCELVEDETQWSKGDEKNTVFYTSPSNYKVSQDLQYLLDIHCGDESTNYDPCFFKLERPTELGKVRQFTLKPISEYFKKAGNSDSDPREYQIELFKIASMSDTQKDGVNAEAPKVYKAPKTINKEFKQNYFILDFSVINAYKFLEMSPKDATEDISNHFLVNYNVKNKQFNIQMDKVEDARDHIKDKYIKDNVMSKDQSIIFPINNLAKDGYNTTVDYTLNFTESSRKSEGRNKVIISALFKNLGISFRALGATLRQPGRFIGIILGRYNNEQDYDNRLEGQYLITEVTHEFEPKKKTYYNNIIAVKSHLYEKDKFEIPYDDDVELIK